jgi:hypothetical protein
MTTTFTSFSGADIHAVFGDTVFGEIQMISYKQDREKAPVYTMGSADLRTIARGKRLITGACVFVVFDKDGLLAAMNANKHSKPYISKEETSQINASADASAKAQELGGSISDLSGSSFATTLGSSALKFTEQRDAYHLDQLLPFDITVVGANEYGAVSKMVFHGVELMTEAGGMSIDDMVLEKQVAFIARRISQWKVEPGAKNAV